MLVPRFALQNLIRLGKEVSRLAYQSPPPPYLRIANLKGGVALITPTNRKNVIIKKNDFLMKQNY
jgi:hypothetical protein